jgi:probable F420-dependent oxidoreductase
MSLDYGLFNINIGACSHPHTLAAVARAAEDAGWESLWTGEHIVLPDPQVPPSPLPPQSRMLDGGIALAFAAAHTERLKLGTGIIILPQRNPLVLAKELASLDVLSKGRLLFGLGVGYLEPEFRALGIPMEERGARSIEYVEAMRAVWSMAEPAYEGRFVSFSGVDAHPRPVQQPGPPVIMGGHSPAAYRRAVTHGDGWYGFALSAEQTAASLQGLREAAERYERPPGMAELEISVTPSGRFDVDSARRFEELGVHRVVLLPRNPPGAERGAPVDADAVLRYVDEVATTLINA